MMDSKENTDGVPQLSDLKMLLMVNWHQKLKKKLMVTWSTGVLYSNTGQQMKVHSVKQEIVPIKCNCNTLLYVGNVTTRK